MSDTTNDSSQPGPPPTDEGAVAGTGPEIDEELLALAGPAPSLRHTLFILLIIGLSLWMFAWFFSDVVYLVQGFWGAEDLGESADLWLEELEPDSYATIHGLPLIKHSVEFRKGVRWFGDTERHVFPLTGQSGLVVEWKMPDEAKAYVDPRVDPVRHTLPYDFSGHLLRRKDLGRNYDKVWLFFDCLERYSMGRCKLCLGTDDMERCRFSIACLETHSDEDCEQILGGAAEKTEGREMVEQTVRELKYAELVDGLERLEQRFAGRKLEVKQLEQDVVDIGSGAMQVRLEQEIVHWKARLADSRKLENTARDALTAKGRSQAELEQWVRHLGDQVAVEETAIRGLSRQAEKIKEDLDAMPNTDPQAVSSFRTELEQKLHAAITTLQAELPPLKEEAVPSMPDAGVEPEPAEKGRSDPRAVELAGLEQELAALRRGKLAEWWWSQLEKISQKIEEHQTSRRKLQSTKTGNGELLEQLRDLPRVVREREDKLAELGREMQRLSSGQMLSRTLALIDVHQPYLSAIGDVSEDFARLNEMLDIEQPDNLDLDELLGELTEIEQLTRPPRWILIDGTVPLDKLWVIAVYAIFSVMIIFNIRHLRRFWVAWRS